jgi:hypothetical protein
MEAPQPLILQLYQRHPTIPTMQLRYLSRAIVYHIIFAVDTTSQCERFVSTLMYYCDLLYFRLHVVYEVMYHICFPNNTNSYWDIVIFILSDNSLYLLVMP